MFERVLILVIMSITFALASRQNFLVSNECEPVSNCPYSDFNSLLDNYSKYSKTKNEDSTSVQLDPEFLTCIFDFYNCPYMIASWTNDKNGDPVYPEKQGVLFGLGLDISRLTNDDVTAFGLDKVLLKNPSGDHASSYFITIADRFRIAEPVTSTKAAQKLTDKIIVNDETKPNMLVDKSQLPDLFYKNILPQYLDKIKKEYDATKAEKSTPFAGLSFVLQNVIFALYYDVANPISAARKQYIKDNNWKALADDCRNTNDSSINMIYSAMIMSQYKNPVEKGINDYYLAIFIDVIPLIDNLNDELLRKCLNNQLTSPACDYFNLLTKISTLIPKLSKKGSALDVYAGYGEFVKKVYSSDVDSEATAEDFLSYLKGIIAYRQTYLDSKASAARAGEGLTVVIDKLLNLAVNPLDKLFNGSPKGLLIISDETLSKPTLNGLNYKADLLLAHGISPRYFVIYDSNSEYPEYARALNFAQGDSLEYGSWCQDYKVISECFKQFEDGISFLPKKLSSNITYKNTIRYIEKDHFVNYYYLRNITAGTKIVLKLILKGLIQGNVKVSAFTKDFRFDTSVKACSEDKKEVSGLSPYWIIRLSESCYMGQERFILVSSDFEFDYYISFDESKGMNIDEKLYKANKDIIPDIPKIEQYNYWASLNNDNGSGAATAVFIILIVIGLILLAVNAFLIIRCRKNSIEVRKLSENMLRKI